MMNFMLFVLLVSAVYIFFVESLPARRGSASSYCYTVIASYHDGHAFLNGRP